MGRRRAPRTVLELATRKLGVHRGALAAAHIAQWVIVTADLGRVPTTAEYADWWAVTERTGWNHRASCRDVLGDDWQGAVALLASEVADAGSRSPRAVMRLGVVA